MKTIFAHTDPTPPEAGQVVPYFNLSEGTAHGAWLTVRNQAGNQAGVDIPDDVLGQLAWAINQHLGRRDAGALQEYQLRVVDECSELKQRLSRLEAFILTATFHALPGAEQKRMRDQFATMCSYWSILDERIRNFPEPQTPAIEAAAPL